MANESTQAQFKFRRNETIGRPAAEDDQEFLGECFEDTGDLNYLLDPSDPKCIVVGRTGSGKTALLLQMKERIDHGVLINLEDLALSYLTNSSILRKLNDLGVNLDHFFKVLWKHAFIIELIRLKYPMTNEKETRSFFDKLRNLFESDRRKDLALKYLEEHENSFFQTAHLRIKEITGKLENSVHGALATKLGVIDPELSVDRSTSVERKAEIVYLAQDIVSQAQLSELNTLFGIMKDDLFNDRRPTYFIMIDKLDEGVDVHTPKANVQYTTLDRKPLKSVRNRHQTNTILNTSHEPKSTTVLELKYRSYEMFTIIQEFTEKHRGFRGSLFSIHPLSGCERLHEGWIEDVFRYRLIRALLDTAREFAKIPGVKIILALRKDLIERVFQLTSDPGTQREKYQSHYLNLEWNKSQLIDILDKRIAALVRRRYTKTSVTHAELLPMSVGKQGIADYLVERTHYRPRDVIMFFNACMEKAVDNPNITLSMLREAETEYSSARLRALCDEWRSDYQDLESYTSILKGQSPVFTLGELDLQKLSEFCLSRASVMEDDPKSPLGKHAKAAALGDLEPFAFAQRVMSILYRVGLVGLKTDKFDATRWSFLQGADIHPATIDRECSVTICPAFYRCLGIKPPK